MYVGIAKLWEHHVKLKCYRYTCAIYRIKWRQRLFVCKLPAALKKLPCGTPYSGASTWFSIIATVNMRITRLLADGTCIHAARAVLDRNHKKSTSILHRVARSAYLGGVVCRLSQRRDFCCMRPRAVLHARCSGGTVVHQQQGTISYENGR